MDDFRASIASCLENFNANFPVEVHSPTATTSRRSVSTVLEQQNLSLGETAAKLIANHSPALLAAAAATAAGIKCSNNYLPPMGVFWDIENCQVPKGRSATAVTRVIRDRFLNGYREAEFVVVCDVQKENKQIIQELNDAQVDLIHVSATCKNAADLKLRQSIRRFGDIHGSPAAIVLISGDINFAADLSDLRHRKKVHCILLHNENTSEALILCADEHYDFTKLLSPLPLRTPNKTADNYYLAVYNLPEDKDVTGIKRRLKQLSNNCGGRVIRMKFDKALVRFSSQETADRAQKRMHGEYVYDSRIEVKHYKQNCGSKNQVFESNGQEGTASESEASDTPKQQQMYGINNPIVGARSVSVTPHYHAGSPVIGAYPNWNGMPCSHQGLHQPHSYGRNYSGNDGNRMYSDRAASPVWVGYGNQPPPGVNRFPDDRSKADKGRPPQRRGQYPPSGYASGDGMHYQRSKGPPVHLRGSAYPPPAEWSQPPRPPWTMSHNGPSYNHQLLKRRSPSPMLQNSSSNQNRDANLWNGQGPNSTSSRSDLTPSPYELPSTGPQAGRTSAYTDSENQEAENFFQCENSTSYMPIELQVTNLDQNFDPKEIKRLLTNLFMECCLVLQASVFVQSDGNTAATIKVPSLQEAQLAISRLHRVKVGYKKILISYAHSGGPNPQQIRSQIVMLLREVPGHKLPLFTFREMYESRFMVSISISELYKLKDVCIITDDSHGRMVALNEDHRNTPSPNVSFGLDGQCLDLPYCTIHAQKPWTDKGWAEQEMASLPNVRLGLKVLNERVQIILAAHSGSLPLPSFPSCYLAICKEPIPEDENGVPLEHLISCLPSVELKQGTSSVKQVCAASKKDSNESHDEGNRCSNVPPPLQSQMALFSRELVDLLKTAPHCQLLFNRFIPAYHHHFGRQCRVADYGYTKLIDLLEALDHTIQVMGEGNKRVVTLSHRAQVRRFTSDLLRVLKAQASKQVTLSEFPMVYARVIGKNWDVTDYGVCDMDDILGEVSENSVVVTLCADGHDRLIAIPKREQTAEEMERTRQFAVEVVELLKHAPQQRMLFNKFVPSYHHHFGHQCRVSDYGFTKLIELFEAIPDTVKIEDVAGGERRISLTESVGIRVLGEQIAKLINRSNGGQLNIANVEQAFLQAYGFMLRPESFNCETMTQLMERLDGSIRVIKTRNDVTIIALNKANIETFGLECRKTLMDAPGYCLLLDKFKRLYEQTYHKECPLDKFTSGLDNYIHIFSSKNERFVELTPIQQFACNVHKVLMHHGGKLYMSQFDSSYLKIIGSTCRPVQFGFPTLYALLKALSCTVVIKEMRQKRKILISLNKKLAAVGIPIPTRNSATSSHQDTDSSNESVDCDYSSSSLIDNADPKDSWDEVTLTSSRYSWVRNPDHYWGELSPTSRPQQWMKNIQQVATEFAPPAAKHDSPQDEQDPDLWKSMSIWSNAASPKYYNPDMSAANIEVPNLNWTPFSSSVQPDDLLSPMKGLLSAASNPLDPRDSPYFANTSSVQAPHPSELPLPSMSSFTPKKNSSLNQTSELSGSKDSPNLLTFLEGETERANSTPSKRSCIGKRRLAAQFNQIPGDP